MHIKVDCVCVYVFEEIKPNIGLLQQCVRRVYANENFPPLNIVRFPRERDYVHYELNAVGTSNRMPANCAQAALTLNRCANI